MAIYPRTLSIINDSNIELDDGFIAIRATNGQLKVRKTMTDEKRTFTIQHLLGQADWDTLWSFYQTNKLLDVTLYWPGEIDPFTVRFLAAPRRTGSHVRMYSVTVKLGEV